MKQNIKFEEDKCQWLGSGLLKRYHNVKQQDLKERLQKFSTFIKNGCKKTA